MGFLLFLVFVVLLVAIDLTVGNFFRKRRRARTAARAVAGAAPRKN